MIQMSTYKNSMHFRKGLVGGKGGNFKIFLNVRIENQLHKIPWKLFQREGGNVYK